MGKFGSEMPFHCSAGTVAAGLVVGAALIPVVKLFKEIATDFLFPRKPLTPPVTHWEGTGGDVDVFYDTATSTLTYIVHDPQTKDAVIIDPVLDFDPIAWQTNTKSIEKIANFIAEKKLKLLYSLETHVHADHMTASQWLKCKFPSCKLAIGAPVCKVQETFKHIFDLPSSTSVDGSQYDKLMKDGEVLHAGSIDIKAIGCPGHTPACVSYLIGNFVFTGDALFLEDCGSGRCDFPEGSAEALYNSIHERLYQLPDEIIVCPGHDYPGGKGRSWNWRTTIGKEAAENISIKLSTQKPEFVKWRKDRDSKLVDPHLIYQSVQVNLNAGRLPAPHENGIRYMTIPLNLKMPTDEASVPVSK